MRKRRDRLKAVFLTAVTAASIFLMFYQIEQCKAILADESDYLDSPRHYKYELSRYRLVYGAWEVGGYVANSGTDDQESGLRQIGKTIEFHPDYLKVDGEKAEGNVHILCNLIPEENIEEFMNNQEYVGDKGSELKAVTADFYTVARLLTRPDNKRMEELRGKVPGEGSHLYVKDSDTLILGTDNGYYILNRTGYIDGVDEEGLADYMGEI